MTFICKSCDFPSRAVSFEQIVEQGKMCKGCFEAPSTNRVIINRKEYNRAYYLANKDTLNTKMKNYYYKNSEEIKAQKKIARELLK